MKSRFINYRCDHCGCKLASESAMAGKEDICPECAKITLVPIESSIGPMALVRKIPMSVYIGTATVVVMAGWALVAWLALRDTWERDYGPEIYQMSTQAIELLSAGNDADGFARYEAMLTMIGDRELEDPELMGAVANAREKFLPIQNKMVDQRILRQVGALEAQATAAIKSGDIRRVLLAHTDALELMRQQRTENPKLARELSTTSRIAAITNELAKEVTALEAREASEALEREKRENGWVMFRGKFMSPGEYARVKTNFPAKEIRERIESDRGLKYFYSLPELWTSSLVVASITKSGDLEFPYHVVVTLDDDPNEGSQEVITLYVSDELELKDSFSHRGQYGEIAQDVYHVLNKILATLKEVS